MPQGLFISRRSWGAKMKTIICIISLSVMVRLSSKYQISGYVGASIDSGWPRGDVLHPSPRGIRSESASVGSGGRPSFTRSRKGFFKMPSGGPVAPTQESDRFAYFGKNTSENLSLYQIQLMVSLRDTARSDPL